MMGGRGRRPYVSKSYLMFRYMFLQTLKILVLLVLRQCNYCPCPYAYLPTSLLKSAMSLPEIISMRISHEMPNFAPDLYRFATLTLKYNA